MATVNWTLIGLAMGFYRNKGFKPIDLPWAVKRAVGSVTCPDQSRMYPFEDKVLVGSAEQAFMEAQFAGDLAPGRYVACTPCFRNEPVLDELHLKHFMKVELYSTTAEDGLDLDFAKLAQTFLAQFAYIDAEIVPTDEGFDLMVAGVEVGSYSSRQFAGQSWTCGTGLAEPRLSIAKAKL